MRQAPKNVGMAIQSALRQLESANPDLLAGIFGDAPWTNRERLPDETSSCMASRTSRSSAAIPWLPHSTSRVIAFASST